MNKGVIIISTSVNEHANSVSSFLTSQKVSLYRLNLDQTGNINASLIFFNEEPVFVLNEKLIKPSEISGVFLHLPKMDLDSSLGSDDLDRKIISASWNNLINGLENFFPNARWVNKRSISSHSTQVFRQLNLAQEIGFKIPSSCFTNDKAELDKFAQKFGKIILKPGPLLGVPFKKQRILSHIVDPSKINTEALKLAPCLFQNYIEKQFELRVHVIGENVLTCKIESQKSSIAREDWRRYDLENTPHSVFNLSTELERKCIQITRELGLEMGVIDLIVTPDNEFFFLECNSQGHWLWIEKLTGLPITQAVGEYLMGES